MKIPEQYRRLYRAAKEQGWECQKLKGGHVRLTSPAGAIVVMPSSPGRARSWLHCRAELRRAGLKV